MRVLIAVIARHHRQSNRFMPPVASNRSGEYCFEPTKGCRESRQRSRLRRGISQAAADQRFSPDFRKRADSDLATLKFQNHRTLIMLSQ